jgi:Family of unknown function (DUF6159)
MFGVKAKRGVDVTWQSWQVLQRDRQLIVFPAVSVIAASAILGTIVAAGYLFPEFGQRTLSLVDAKQPHSSSERALGISILFALYFVEWFVVIIFNTALIGCALIRFEGSQPKLKDGFRIAFSRLPQIIAWSLFSASIGVLLGAIERRLGATARIGAFMVGLAWAVATYFVVPVLAVEGAGPITALSRSVELLKKTWGESLAGNFVIEAGSWALAFFLIAVAAVGLLLAFVLASMVVTVVTLTIVAIGLMYLAIVSSALRQIFLAGLYRYATTGEAPKGFSEMTLRQALRRS